MYHFEVTPIPTPEVKLMNTTQNEDNEAKGLIEKMQQFIEQMIDQVTTHDHQKVRDYVDGLYLKDSHLSQTQIAQKIINHQSNISGFAGAITGMGGLVTLPVTIPIDLVKHLHIQAYTICALSHLYGYPLDRPDLKTDLLLILSDGSFKKIAEFLAKEAKSHVKDKHTVEKAVAKLISQRISKQVSIHSLEKAGQAFGAKYAAKIVVDMGGKALRDYALRNVPKIFRGIVWKVASKKIAQQTIQKSLTKVLPLLGAVIGGGMDWWGTQSVGKSAIDYYENDGPFFVEELYSLMNLDN